MEKRHCLSKQAAGMMSECARVFVTKRLLPCAVWEAGWQAVLPSGPAWQAKWWAGGKAAYLWRRLDCCVKVEIDL